ncbi:MAG TPA: hypothetical protein VER96_24150 [Polyangiaceae bacterium]|nr:hypothetical protein [Polyangiaceae bacterium]
MTARSVSWTDPSSVAQLLARASAPRRAAVQSFSRANASSAARPIPRPAPVVAAAAPEAPAPRAITIPPPTRLKSQFPAPKLVQTSDNPSDCLDALLAWTLDHQRCTGAFIADENGLTLAAHGISEAHVSLVGPLLSALVSVRMIPGIDATAGALWLGNSMMSWVESRNDRGAFCLGILGPEPLSSRAFDQLKEALEVTVRRL